MSGLEFASTLITHALWPLVAVAVIIVFRKPLKDLLDRIRSYEGPGGKFTFGEKLARAEESVSEAIASSPVESEKSLVAEPPPEALARAAEANPSSVILETWEALSRVLADLFGSFGINTRGPGRVGVATAARALQQRPEAPFGFADAVRGLLDLRNAVAHGQHNPTAGEAVAYALAARDLSATARSVLAKRDPPPE